MLKENLGRNIVFQSLWYVLSILIIKSFNKINIVIIRYLSVLDIILEDVI